jgi:hypothetical protein
MPWTEEAQQFLTAPDEGLDDVAVLTRALEAERQNMAKQVRLAIRAVDEPQEVQDALRAERAAIAARIEDLESMLAETQQRVQILPDLKALHEKLLRTEIPQLLESFSDVQLAREFILLLVKSARIVDRRPAINSKWLRFDVEWTPEITALLEAGLLRLDAPDEGPRVLTKQEQKREQQRRARARKKQLGCGPGH